MAMRRLGHEKTEPLCAVSRILSYTNTLYARFPECHGGTSEKPGLHKLPGSLRGLRVNAGLHRAAPGADPAASAGQYPYQSGSRKAQAALKSQRRAASSHHHSIDDPDPRQRALAPVRGVSLWYDCGRSGGSTSRNAPWESDCGHECCAGRDFESCLRHVSSSASDEASPA